MNLHLLSITQNRWQHGLTTSSQCFNISLADVQCPNTLRYSGHCSLDAAFSPSRNPLRISLCSCAQRFASSNLGTSTLFLSIDSSSRSAENSSCYIQLNETDCSIHNLQYSDPLLSPIPEKMIDESYSFMCQSPEKFPTCQVELFAN